MRFKAFSNIQNARSTRNTFAARWEDYAEILPLWIFQGKNPQKQQKEQILHMIAKNTAHGIGFSIWKNWSYSIRMSIFPIPYIQLAVHTKPVNLLPLSQFGHQTRWLLLDSENGTWQKQVDWQSGTLLRVLIHISFVLFWFGLLCFAWFSVYVCICIALHWSRQ